ncbi:MAG: DUF1987 domain-containing protein [Bacteroidetes bacterium]|nr:MAG: DUF1987 domain-containing protein [Bacteroidota bacterium]REK04741.1 MAG: DUF1987 domain-containing protein [Bacteroidota bacterium]REK36215.1 MAG: DUF1987 domain-containing protein [Bacteroidota bacterium]REK51414.1 MAG: DUF1987 domain-containing protein [Bacteroidota bacterium]
MEALIIEESVKTPSIQFNPQNGILEIKGKSIPENSLDFYGPVFNWLDEFLKNGTQEAEFRVQLEYFNTSSSKCLLDIFRKLENGSGGNGKIRVKWYYEEDDEDMMEAGDDYKALVKLPFEFIKI